MSDKTSDRLLNCPFCGGQIFVRPCIYKNELSITPKYAAGCENPKCPCYVQSKIYNTIDEAIDAWNTRKPMERIIERLERLKGKDFISSEDYEGNVEFHFYGHTSEHDEMIRFAIEIVKEEGGINA